MTRFCKHLIQLSKFETGRISSTSGTMYFIGGIKVHTSTVPNGSICYLNGKRYDYGYVQETVIASGETYPELLKSVHAYVKMTHQSWEEFLKFIPPK